MMNFFGGNNPKRRVERLLAKGERLFRHGKEREGLEKFAEAANVLPEASKPSLHLGRAYYKLKKYDLALKHYYKALYFCEITEEHGILCEIAQIYLDLKRYDIAEEKLKKVLHLDLPLSPSYINEVKKTAINGLAYIYLHTGRISEAIEQQKILLEHVPENIQVIQMLAESHRLLGENRKARALLQKASELAKYTDRHADLEHLERKLRAVEFPDGTEFGIKEQLYAEYGSICLGTSSDDGLTITPRNTLAPLSSEELAVTLRRLTEFIHIFSWAITCIVTNDKGPSLLSSILAFLLNVPVKTMSKVTDHDNVLFVQRLFNHSKQTQKILRKLGKRANLVVTFSLFASVDSEGKEYLPDIIGIPIEKEVTISRRNSGSLLSRSSSETASPEKIRQQLLDAFYDIPEEENLSQQIAYYRHVQLRSHLAMASRLQESFSESPKNTTHEEMITRLLSKQRAEVFAALKSIRDQGLQTPSILPALKTLYVEHRDAAIRRVVGQHLLTIAPNEGLEYLIALFHNPDTDVLLKISIVDTLGLSSNRKISAVLSSALQAPHEDLRIHAVRYLHKLDLSEEFSDLCEQLLHDIPAIIIKTIQYLTPCEGTPMFCRLRKCLPNLLRHEDPAVIHESLIAVQKGGNRALTSTVRELLAHNDQHIVEHAIVTIGAIGDIDCGYHLLPFLEHESPGLRYAAAESLTKLDHRRSIVFLMERLQKESPDVQTKLLTLLGEVGSHDTVPLIVRFAEQHLENFQIVSAAMKTLAQSRDSRSLDFARKAITKFPHNEIVGHYIAIAGNTGKNKDIEILITFLESPPAIQFRIAALLYQHGKQRYFRILQDGIRSKKLSISLLAVEILGAIGDELSFQVMCSAFERQDPQLDKKLVEKLCQQRTSSEYALWFRNLQAPEAEMIQQGLDRAIQDSHTVREVMNGFESLYVLLQSEAIPVIRQLCSETGNSVILRGAMTYLAQYDPTGNQAIIRKYLSHEDVEVANTAYLLLNKRKNMLWKPNHKLP